METSFVNVHLNVLFVMLFLVIPISLIGMFLCGVPAIPQAQFFGVRSSNLLRIEGSAAEAGTAGNAAQASTTISQEIDLNWVKKDKRRLLHVVYRVGDLDKTIKYIVIFIWMSILTCMLFPSLICAILSDFTRNAWE